MGSRSEMVPPPNRRPTDHLRRQLNNFQVPKGSGLVQKLLEIKDYAELMRDAGIQVDVKSVYGIYVAALLSEYELEI